YRLAIELGLIEAKYLDHHARLVLAMNLAKEETRRLQLLPPDTTQWGGWASQIHESGLQRNRQYRAYAIAREEGDIHQNENGWTVHGYGVALDGCECMDFLDRKLPCKHIYSVALASQITLPFTEPEFQIARKQGLEIVFQFETGS